MRLLIIDNFDSFTYNLEQYAHRYCDNVDVKRNTEISIDEVDDYDAIIISPGPGLPSDAGITPLVIERYSATKKILGVCLGHQAIAESFGANLQNLEEPLHGISISTSLTNVKDKIFDGIANDFQTARYHSWVVEPSSIENTELQITATDINNQIQALKHKRYNVRSVQFHPESILTDGGMKMIENWILKC